MMPRYYYAYDYVTGARIYANPMPAWKIAELLGPHYKYSLKKCDETHTTKA
jgi:hypothetical protein